MKSIGVVLAACAAVAAVAEVNDRGAWTDAGRAPADTTLKLAVALQEENLDKLDEIFWAVSTPGNPQYGKHRSMEAIRDLTAASRVTVAKAMRAMHAHGATCALAGSKAALDCKMSVGDVEKMLDTEVHTFTHSKKGVSVHRVPRDLGWTFPSHEDWSGVRFIGGLTNLPIPRYGRPAVVDTGTQSVVPETLTTVYNIAVSGDSSVTQAAAEFQGEPAYSDSDLSTFLSNTGVASFSIEKHFGPFDQSNPQAEPTLDIQYLGAVAEGNTNWYWTEAQWLYDFATSLLGNPAETPDVVSMSYGWNEEDQCQIEPNAPACISGGSTAYVQAVNTQFQKLGAAGITLVAASGDSGAHGRTDPFCLDPKAHPAFPAASPYLTAVGATMFEAGTIKTGGSEPICSSELSCITGGTEIVCSNAKGALITSGGGFSNVASRPSYQDSVVTAYLKDSSNTPGAGNFNASGRGYPDVAAQGHSYYIELNGQVAGVDGTSCACPVFAGVLSLLNAHRVKGGGSKLGFANPMLYKMAADHPAAFNDITSGNNYCTEDICCSNGYTATKGWDATTGLGTPNVAEMIKALDAIDAAATRALRG